MRKLLSLDFLTSDDFFGTKNPQRSLTRRTASSKDFQKGRFLLAHRPAVVAVKINHLVFFRDFVHHPFNH